MPVASSPFFPALAGRLAPFRRVGSWSGAAPHRAFSTPNGLSGAAGFSLVCRAQDLASRRIYQMGAIAGQADESLKCIFALILVRIISQPTLHGPASCGAPIQKGCNWARLRRLWASALTHVKQPTVNTRALPVRLSVGGCSF